MNDYPSTYGRAIRYSADERAAFESTIDDNPLESTTHLVYADWLDEQGEHDEAAFRRAMGEWVSRGHRVSDQFKPPTDESRSFEEHQPSQSVNLSTDESGQGFTHTVYRSDLPDWASSLEHVGENRHGVTLTDPAVAYHPNIYWYHWRGYWSMEEGLRRAFLRGRSRE